MKYDIWKVHKQSRLLDQQEAEEFEATGLFVNKHHRIGYRTSSNKPVYDGPVLHVTEDVVTGTVIVETKEYQYMIKQLEDNKGLH